MRLLTRLRGTLAVLLAGVVVAFLPSAGAAVAPLMVGAVVTEPDLSLTNSQTPTTQPPGGGFTAVTPARLLDTRIGNGAPMHTVPAGGQVEVQISGRGGVPVTGVSSVVLNVTVTRPASAGYLTVFPGGAPRPAASNVNFRAGQTVANLVIVGLGVNGRVILYTTATTHLIVDVTGWFSTPAAASDHSGLFHPLEPARIADTRSSFGMTTPSAGETRTLVVVGRGGVPASGVSAVVINVTVAHPSAGGYLTVYPAGQPRPTASSINFVTGDIRANRAAVALGSGNLSIYNATGSTPIIVDVVGWFSDDSAAPDSSATTFVSVTPSRLIDTRAGKGDLPGPLAADNFGGQRVFGFAGVPSGTGSAFPVAVVGNLTAVRPSTNGYLSVVSADVSLGTSDLNVRANDVVANVIVAKLYDGGFQLHNSAGVTNVVFDVSGYFALATPALNLVDPVPNALVEGLTVSTNGRFLAATATSPLTSGDTNMTSDVYLIDRTDGRRIRVSVSTASGQANGASHSPAVSDDGRYVAFVSDATNLVPGDTNGAPDVFVRDTVANTTTLLSSGVDASAANGWSGHPSISNAGTRVAFESYASNLVVGDTNHEWDVFVADLTAGTLTRVSVSSAGIEGDSASWRVMISGGGDQVAFISEASNLVAGDTNSFPDVFVRDLTTNVTTRESVSSSGEQANDDYTDFLSISDAGDLIAFGSMASNLVPSDTNNAFDLFLRNRTTNTTTRITSPGGLGGWGEWGEGIAQVVDISGDGSTILFHGKSRAFSPTWSDVAGWVLYAYRVGDGSITAIRGGSYFGSDFFQLTGDGSQAIVQRARGDPDPYRAGEWVRDYVIISVP